MALLRSSTSFMTFFPRLLNFTRNIISKDFMLLGGNSLVKKREVIENTKTAIMVLPIRSYSSFGKEQMVRVSLTLITAQGKRILIEGECENLIELISENYSNDFTGFGVCGGGCSCGTCLVCMKPEDYLFHKNSHNAEEIELIDTKWENIGPHCRLLCQLQLEKVNGLEVTVVDKKKLRVYENSEEICG